MTIPGVELKLQELRIKYKNTIDTDMRAVIVAQGKCLKIVLEQKINSAKTLENSQTYDDAKSIFQG